MGEIIYEDVDQTELKTTENHGRGLFATKCIAPGTTILTELPYAWAIMKQYRGLVCDNCSIVYEAPKPKKNVGPDGIASTTTVASAAEKEAASKQSKGMKRCGACKLQWYCSSACQKEAWNRIHKYECKILKQVGSLPENHHGFLIFRTLLKLSKNLDEDRDQQIIRLEPNFEAKIDKEISQCYDFCMGSDLCKDFLSQLVKQYGFDDPFHIIVEMAARLINNRMALGPDEDCNGTAVGTGIYPKASMANHSCRPNALWQTYKGNRIILRVQEDIPEGEEIYLSYLDTTLDSKKRQAEILKNYNFPCDCRGCATCQFDDEQTEGGVLEELIAAGDEKAIANLPNHNMGVLQRLQKAFDEAVRYDKDAEKAYDIGERLIKGMSYYLNLEDHSRPDFKRAAGVQYMFMGELALALTKDPRLTQAYLFKAEEILKITDSEESTVFARIKKIRNLLVVLHVAHQKAYGGGE